VEIFIELEELAEEKSQNIHVCAHVNFIGISPQHYMEYKRLSFNFEKKKGVNL
jgi:hypothetical protein